MDDTSKRIISLARDKTVQDIVGWCSEDKRRLRNVLWLLALMMDNEDKEMDYETIHATLIKRHGKYGRDRLRIILRFLKSKNIINASTKIDVVKRQKSGISVPDFETFRGYYSIKSMEKVAMICVVMGLLKKFKVNKCR